MALYCGIDLHSRDCWLAILDEELKVIQESKVGNDIEALLQVLEPHGCHGLRRVTPTFP